MRITFKRFTTLLKYTETHILLSLFSFLIFTWPFICETEDASQGRLFFHILMSWFFIIVILFTMSVSAGADKIEPTNTDKL